MTYRGPAYVFDSIRRLLLDCTYHAYYAAILYIGYVITWLYVIYTYSIMSKYIMHRSIPISVTTHEHGTVLAAVTMHHILYAALAIAPGFRLIIVVRGPGSDTVRFFRRAWP